ncbi:MAG: SapC family protein [Candidatus Magnetomorum sp.]|nr:SapC family protein [Candidatus Magnetomorum sp.]
MTQQFVPVTKEAHQNKKIKPVYTFDFASEIHMVSVMMHEFTNAATVYPIVFLEDPEKSDFRPMALLGLEPQVNLFITDEGKWNAPYIPAIIRRYPFALAKTQQEDQYTVCIDEASASVNEDDGQPLFKEDGSLAPLMEQVKQYLTGLQQMETLTSQFCKTLKDKYMFTPLNMQVREANNVKRLTGAYAIHEERLNNLSDEDFLSFRKQNFLPAIYSHLTSLAQINHLVQLQNEKKNKN